jgi:hypothetical protein
VPRGDDRYTGTLCQHYRKGEEGGLRQIVRQPNGRAYSKAQLADNLITISKNFAKSDGVVARRDVVRKELFLHFLIHRDSSKVGLTVGKGKGLPSPAGPLQSLKERSYIKKVPSRRKGSW